MTRNQTFRVWSFDALGSEVMGESGEIEYGKPYPIHYRTTATFTGSVDYPIIEIRLYETVIARLGRGEVRINRGSHKTEMTKRRLNMVTVHFGYAIASRGDEWKVINVSTQESCPFVEGMTLIHKKMETAPW